MASIEATYDNEDGTACQRIAETVVYIRAITQAEEVARLLDPQQPSDKRGKKGKSKKDWQR